MEEYVYDNTNRKKTFLVRFTDEEHEALRYVSFVTKKPINQIIIEKLFKKDDKTEQ